MYKVCERIIVVGGHNIDIVRDICKSFPKAELVYNKNYANGMSLDVVH